MSNFAGFQSYFLFSNALSVIIMGSLIICFLFIMVIISNNFLKIQIIHI